MIREIIETLRGAFAIGFFTIVVLACAGLAAGTHIGAINW